MLPLRRIGTLHQTFVSLYTICIVHRIDHLAVVRKAVEQDVVDDAVVQVVPMLGQPAALVIQDAHRRQQHTVSPIQPGIERGDQTRQQDRPRLADTSAAEDPISANRFPP